MPTDVMQGWSNFFTGELDAAATLTGLLFVAVSINLTEFCSTHICRGAPPRHWPRWRR